MPNSRLKNPSGRLPNTSSGRREPADVVEHALHDVAAVRRVVERHGLAEQLPQRSFRTSMRMRCRTISLT
jgi:hypothetical protein